MVLWGFLLSLSALCVIPESELNQQMTFFLLSDVLQIFLPSLVASP